MDVFLATETLVIELLLVVSLVAIAVRRLRVPYTVALVVVGLVLTFGGSLPFDLTPDLILVLFVPPLVFEAALHLEFGELRRHLRPILLLAIAGVLLTTALVGTLVTLGTGVALPVGLIFGALIAATDPVVVVALFRVLGAPKPLTVLVEGESLLNDGTAIVVFHVVLAFALSMAAGGTQPPELSVLVVGAVVDFVRVAAGGALIGLALGWLIAQVIARLDDYLIETTLTTVLAFGAYLMAERLHLSGVLAVVVAGIVCGSLGLKGMSPTTRIVLFTFWEYAAFIANSLIFLLIGLAINLPDLLAQIGPIAVAVTAVLVSRALVVYGLTWLSNRRRGRVPLRYQHVQFWGGLRGAISLALALSLPASFADRDLVLVMTFGVVLFTLLVQGTTMHRLLKHLGLVEREEAELEYERRHGRLM
ncbi:MAG: Na+/H+ antiporter, partial [Chloroflexales bacterium]|nr:Na+/H+ antiporter [Chloroflexales bacterium]